MCSMARTKSELFVLEKRQNLLPDSGKISKALTYSQVGADTRRLLRWGLMVWPRGFAGGQDRNPVLPGGLMVWPRCFAGEREEPK